MSRALQSIAESVQGIYEILRPRLSAILKIKKHSTNIREEVMPASIQVGKTATATWQEWSGPNGTGDKLPPAGPVTFQSSDATIATVDLNSGLITGVAAGTATISGSDSANSLTASDTVTVTAEVAQSATLTITAN